MNTIRSICVFCGSSTGTEPSYAETARSLGKALALSGIDLIYGGSNIGLMGIVSAAARDSGGKVTGIIPEKIAEHVPHQNGISLEVVPGMHERKSRMYELADAFIAMPGGIGTLEEFFEAWTWTQLGYHTKPVALLNAAGFYDGLDDFLKDVAGKGFLKSEAVASLIVDSDPASLLEKMADWKPPAGQKWDGAKAST